MTYEPGRNMPGEAGTWDLSAALKFGPLSPRQAWDAAQQAKALARSDEQRESIQVWEQELAWREFYQQALTLLILGTPDFDCAMARKYKERFRMLHDPTHVSLFAADSLARFVRTIGFQIVEMYSPYFELSVFSQAELAKCLDGNLQWSPPFYGNHITYILKKS